jgi:hypothetical protein
VERLLDSVDAVVFLMDYDKLKTSEVPVPIPSHPPSSPPTHFFYRYILGKKRAVAQSCVACSRENRLPICGGPIVLDIAGG